MITVFAPGSWVIVGDDIPATVSRVSISANNMISYEVVWWEDRERNEEWLYAHEVKLHPDAKTIEIGFHALQEEVKE